MWVHCSKNFKTYFNINPQFVVTRTEQRPSCSSSPSQATTCGVTGDSPPLAPVKTMSIEVTVAFQAKGGSLTRFDNFQFLRHISQGRCWKVLLEGSLCQGMVRFPHLNSGVFLANSVCMEFFTLYSVRLCLLNSICCKSEPPQNWKISLWRWSKKNNQNSL